MSNRNRLAVLVLIVLACVTLVACGAGSTGAVPEGASNTDTDTDTSSDTDSGTDSNAPVSPVNVLAVASDAQVTISWDAVADADSYTIYWKNSAGVTTSDAIIENAISPYSHVGLTNGTEYYYVVVAVSAAGQSDLSNEVSATPQVILPARYAFVTSASGAGDLGVWVEAGGATGLAAADAICNSAAMAGDIKLAGKIFKAWISDASTDAYCHIHGLTGQKSTNCGGFVPSPGEAGPWVRMDGKAFADSIDSALNPLLKIYRSVEFYEDGTSADTKGYFTNTDADGKDAGASCQNWTDATGAFSYYAGSSYAAGSQWSEAWNTSCNAVGHLLCLEMGIGAKLPTETAIGKKVFVSSAVGTGNLGSWPQVTGGETGSDAGDAICNTLATDAGLTGSFKAFLSTSWPDARDRITSDGPFVRLDGVIIAEDKVDFMDNSLDAPVNLTEKGVYLPGDEYAWTGSWPHGTNQGDHCLSWTSGNGVNAGSAGDVSFTDDGWGRIGSLPCAGSWHLYCIED